MEIPTYEEFKEKELYKIRRFQNSKMEIYQYSNEPLIRPKTVTQEYNGSYEQKQILNGSQRNISNASNLLYFSLNQEKPIHFINHKLKKLFQQNEILNREYNTTNLEMNYINFNKKIKFEKIQNELEYRELCKLMENPQFDFIMKSKKTIAKWVLTHEYLIYHPDYEFIKRKYSIVLCPSYVYHEEENGSDNENQENNNNSNDENQIYDDEYYSQNFEDQNIPSNPTEEEEKDFYDT